MGKPHIDKAFVLKRLPETELVAYTDDEQTGTVNEDVFNDCADDACEEFYAIISARLSLPLADDYPLARIIIRDICIYNLYARRHDYEMPEEISKRYDKALKSAREIVDGTLTLFEEQDEDPKAGTIVTNKAASDRIFSKDFMSRF